MADSSDATQATEAQAEEDPAAETHSADEPTPPEQDGDARAPAPEIEAMESVAGAGEAPPPEVEVEQSAVGAEEVLADAEDAAFTPYEGNGDTDPSTEVPQDPQAEQISMQPESEAELAQMEASMAGELEFLEEMWAGMEDEAIWKAVDQSALEAPPPPLDEAAADLGATKEPYNSTFHQKFQEIADKNVPVTTLRDKTEARERVAKVKQAKAMIARDSANLGTRQAAAQDMGFRVAKAAELVETMGQELNELLDEEAELMQKKPVPFERLRRVQGWIDERSASLEQQKELVEGLRDAQHELELELRDAELDHSIAQGARDFLEQDAMEEAARTMQATTALQMQEAELVRNIRKRRVLAEAERADEVDRKKEEAQRAIIAAKEGQKKAATRLRHQQDKIREKATAMQTMHEGQFEKRVEAVMQLKGSIDSARKELAAKNTLLQIKRQQRKEDEEAQFNRLLEDGQNPYEVFRRKAEAERVASERKAIKASKKANEHVIAGRLLQDEDEFQRRLAKQQAHREFADSFNEEMGLEAKQARNKAFMLGRTGREILDPTSRLPVPPSQITKAKPWGLGMGTTRPDIVEKLRQKHPTATVKDDLLPITLRDGSDTLKIPTGSDLVGMGAEEDDAQGGTRAGEKELLAKSEFPGPWEKDAVLGRKKLYEPKLSTFEKKAMAAAHERHKGTMIKTQTVMGKEFKGDAFIPTPRVALFKDFEVGKTYQMVVSMTNVSYSKNTFKVLALPDDVRDYFDIQYKFPGHISAGIACNLHITYEPKVNEDIITHIPLMAETGMMYVPLECLTKKVEIIIPEREIDFNSRQGVTLGESLTKTITIENNGALEVYYEMSMANQRTSFFYDGTQLPPKPRASTSDARSATGSQAMSIASSRVSWASSKPGTGMSASVKVGQLGVEEDDDEQQAEIWYAGLSIPCSGKIGGYSKVQFEVQFEPVAPGEVEVELRVRFLVKQKGYRDVKVPQEHISILAVGRDVPIKVQEDVIDLKTCFIGQTYRSHVVVHNQGKNAMKCCIIKRPELGKDVDFIPDFGFCQAGETFAFSMTWRPTQATLRRCERWIEEDSGVLDIPMRVTVPDQVLPVEFRVRILLTTSDITFDPPSLDFGRIVMGQTAGINLRLTNQSVLPQKLGFLSLPVGVKIKQTATMLPNETITRLVSFTPPTDGRHRQTLQCRTVAGRSFPIPLVAEGVKLSLRLSENLITTAATMLGDTTNVSIIMTNTTKVARTFEFLVPEGSGLKFSPKVETVPPKTSIRIQIDFTPPFEEEQPEPEPEPEPEREPEVPAKGKGKDAKGKAKGGKAKTPEPEPEPEPESDDNDGEGEEEKAGEPRIGDHLEELQEGIWTECRKWSVPCYVKPEGDLPMEKMAVQVKTCAVEQEYDLDMEVTPKVPGKPYHKLDFGAVPLGSKVTKCVTVFNIGQDDMPLKSGMVDPYGGFRIVSAVRHISPGGDQGIYVEFLPTIARKFYEMWTLTTGKGHIWIVLQGDGITPSFTLEPEDTTAQSLDLGDIFKGDSAERTFKMHNTSPFPLPYELVFTGGNTHGNLGVLPPFFTKPAEGIIPIEGSHDIKVVFSPDHEFPYFQQVLEIRVPNQQEECAIKLKGRCWEEGMFLSGGEWGRVIEDIQHASSLTEPTIEELSKPRRMTLTCRQTVEPGGSSQVTMHVGNLKPGSGGAANGDYEISELTPAEKAAGWSLDVAKAAVPPGDKKAVVFTFAPPAKQGSSSLTHFGMSEWKECNVRVTLKGGFPPPKSQPAKVVELTVRCFLEPPTPKPPGAEEEAPPADPEPKGKAKGQGAKKK